VRLPADPRGADEAWDQDLRDDGPDNPFAPRLSPCSRSGRPNMDRVPPVTGGRNPRDRLLHRRDDQAQDALRLVLHRASHPEGARCGRHWASRLELGHTTGQEPRDRRTARGREVPRPRPGRQVLGTVRRGASHRGRSHHPNADPRTSGQRLRGAVREDRAPGVPRPRPDLRSSASRAGAPGVRCSLREGETTSGTELGRTRRRPSTAAPGDHPNAGRTTGRARRADPRVSLGSVIRIVEPFRFTA
jgi:hypothetical protein